MSRRTLRLSRRAVLRGAGVSIALPVLEAMLNGRGQLARAATAPRLFTFYFTNGAKPAFWTPKQGEGALARANLSVALEPLGATVGNVDLLPYINVVTGLDHSHSRGPHDGWVFACGDTTPLAAGGFKPAGPSIDQVAAAKHGGQTTLRSLAASVVTGSDRLFPANTLVSWIAGGQPVQPYTDPQKLFTTLFGGVTMGDEPDAARIGRTRSVLDFAMADGARLKARLGSVDRQRVDQHLTAIGELEKRLADLPSTPSCSVAPIAIEGGDWRGVARAHMQLLALAMKCDLVRHGSFMLNGESSYNVYYPWMPETKGLSDHAIAHGAQKNLSPFDAVTRFKVGEFAYFLRLLAGTPEGTGTLLDDTIVFCSSEMGDGSFHVSDDMCVLVAGRGGGLKAGRHVIRRGSNLNDLHCSLLNYAGVATTKWGRMGTGPLTGF